MAMLRVKSPVSGVSVVNGNILKVGSEKLPISNPSGLGGALKAQSYNQAQIKQVYAWLRSL